MTTAEPLDERELNQPEDFEQLVTGARKRLFAIFDDPRAGLEAVRSIDPGDLIAHADIWLMHGEEGRRRLDARAAHHGLFGKLVRAGQLAMSDDNRYIETLDRALAHGALVVALPVGRITVADRLAELLQAASGHSFAYTTHLDFVPTRGEI